MIDDDEGPDLAVSVENSAAIIYECRLVVVIFIVVCEEVNVSFHVVANPVENPKAKTEANRNFMPRWRKANELLEYDEDGKGMFCRGCRDSRSQDGLCLGSQTA